ncbi:lipofamily protein [Butyricimonas sp. RTP31023st2_F12_RTP31023_210422]|uniref:lipofamily protein n=1 Tax=Butyricimonas sp. RTP31023st2_F12_RTP31023_210422 TaxID=3143211 RepID=UPI0034A1471D
MKRGIITNNGQGIHISDGKVWMTTWEIAELFNTTAGVIHAAIKGMLRVGILKEYKICKYIKLENGYNADVYNLEMVIALSYQVNTGHSIEFRLWLTNKVTHKQVHNILVYLNKETSSTLSC